MRRALALSRNIATINVARDGRLRSGRGVVEARRRQHAAPPYPSIALGVFEATPFEVATAYTLFANGGDVSRSM